MWATLRQRNFFLLWLAGLISYIGNWMLWITLPVVVYDYTESALAVSAMVAAGTVPSILFGSVAGVFVDRWERRRTMIAVNGLLALSILPLLLVRSADHIWIMVAARFIQSSLSQFFAPAEGAMLPLLVDQKYLVPANALNSLNNNLARLIGPAVGAVVAVSVGLGGVVVIDALTYLAAAALIALITVRSKPQQVEAAAVSLSSAFGRVKREWVDGMRLIGSRTVVRTLFLGIAITAVGEGVMSTLFVPFVSDVLHAGTLEYSWLVSAQAVGGLVGGLVIGWIGVRSRAHNLLTFGAIMLGVIDLMIFNYPRFFPGVAIGIALFVVVGIPAVAMTTGFDTVIQSEVEDRFRGRVFGSFMTTQALSVLLGTVLAGATADTLGVGTVINIQGVGYVIAGLIFLWMFSRRSAQTQISAPAPEMEA